MNKNKLIKYLLLTFFTIMLVAGCSKSVEIQDVSSTSEEQEALQEQVDKSKQNENATEEAILISSEETDEDNEQSTETKGAETESPEEKEVVSVIVKSENNLSDSEKQEVINQLSKEVDDLLTEINSEE
jgi:outer membrane murein-binding lipoprotein Lpp